MPKSKIAEQIEQIKAGTTVCIDRDLESATYIDYISGQYMKLCYDNAGDLQFLHTLSEDGVMELLQKKEYKDV